MIKSVNSGEILAGASVKSFTFFTGTKDNHETLVQGGELVLSTDTNFSGLSGAVFCDLDGNEQLVVQDPNGLYRLILSPEDASMLAKSSFVNLRIPNNLPSDSMYSNVFIPFGNISMGFEQRDQFNSPYQKGTIIGVKNLLIDFDKATSNLDRRKIMGQMLKQILEHPTSNDLRFLAEFGFSSKESFLQRIMDLLGSRELSSIDLAALSLTYLPKSVLANVYLHSLGTSSIRQNELSKELIDRLYNLILSDESPFQTSVIKNTKWIRNGEDSLPGETKVTYKDLN